MEKLTPEEKRLLGGLVLACHEDLVKGVPPAVEKIETVCSRCKNRNKWKCEVYPEGFPKQVIRGKANCPNFKEK